MYEQIEVEVLATALRGPKRVMLDTANGRDLLALSRQAALALSAKLVSRSAVR